MHRSKRSSNVKLTTMAALGSSAMLSACGSNSAPAAQAAGADEPADIEVQVFENVFACAKKTGFSKEECETMRQEASELSAKEAPRFQAKEDCEEVYGPGQCVEAEAPAEEQTRTRRHFSPFIVAWFSRSQNRSSGPLFRAPGGGYQTANGSRLSYGGQPGKYLASNRAMERARSVPKVKPASAAARAAGFGKPGYGKARNGFGTGKSGDAGDAKNSSRSKGG